MILNRKMTSKDTNSTRDNQAIMLKMVTSYSIFLIIIFILCFCLYHVTLKNLRDSYNQQEKSTLISNVELFEKDFEIMNVYCRQLLQNDDFRKLYSMSRLDDELITLGTDLATALSTDVYPESLLPIEEVYCYLPNSGCILSPNYFTTQDRYYDWMKRYSMDGYENWLKALTTTDNYYRFLPMESMTPNFSKNYYMYLINLDDLFYMDADAVVCFVLEQQEFASLFETIETGSQHKNPNCLIVTDKHSNTVLSLGEHTSEDTDSIISLDYIEDFASYDFGNDTSSIGKYTSKETGYTYYYSFTPFEETADMNTRNILYVLALIFALITGAGLVVLLSRQNVQPIIELGHELDEAVAVQNKLQEVVDNQRPIICNSYVRQLLTGTVTSEEEVSYIKEYLNLIGENLYYNGLYICVYNNANEAQEALPKNFHTPEEFNRIVSDALQDFFGLPLYCFSPADRTYAVLLACPEEEENNFIFQTHEIIVKLHNYLLDTYGIWLFAGIGKNTNDLMNVWESYQQAVESVSYTSKNYFFFPYEFVKKDSNVFYYPPELSTKLIHFITTGNTPQTLELFNLIHQENIEERSLPINILKFLLSDIRNTLLKAKFALPIGVSEDVLKALDEQFNQHVTFKLCEDIALMLCKLFSTETADSSLISTIEKYIEENYADPSMGLNKISDEFQISESYFSHMFKEKTGVNFSTYLENIRMSEAVRLIKETNISLNELYISVGYNNANTFRRAFKKIYGVTPSSMREK